MLCSIYCKSVELTSDIMIFENLKKTEEHNEP